MKEFLNEGIRILYDLGNMNHNFRFSKIYSQLGKNCLGNNGNMFLNQVN